MAAQPQITVPVLTADLERLYQSAISTTRGYDFYLYIADYCLKLEESGHFDPIYQEMYEESRKDMIEYDRTWNEFYAQWAGYARDIIDKVDKKVITYEYKPTSSTVTTTTLHHLSLSYEVLKRHSGLETKVTSIDSQEYGLYGSYCEFLSYLIDSGQKEAIKNHLRSDNNFLLDAAYTAYDEVKEQYQSLREHRPWWAHYQLTRLACAFYKGRYPEEYATYFDKNRFVDHIFASEVDDVKVHRDSGNVYVRRDKFQPYIKTLHEYVMPRLKEKDRKPSETKTEEKRAVSHKLEYYEYDNVLIYRNQRCTPIGLQKALIKIMSNQKNEPVTVQEIFNSSKKIGKNARSQFRNRRQIYDSLYEIKDKLKVGPRGSFPITLEGNDCIWDDK